MTSDACICADGAAPGARCQAKVAEDGSAYFCARHLTLLRSGALIQVHPGASEEDRKAAEAVMRTKRPTSWVREYLSSPGGAAKLAIILAPPLLLAQAAELATLEFPRPMLTASFDSVGLLIDALPQLILLGFIAFVIMFALTALFSALYLPGFAALKAVGGVAWIVRLVWSKSRRKLGRVAADAQSSETWLERRAEGSWRVALRAVPARIGEARRAMFENNRQDGFAKRMRWGGYIAFLILLPFINFIIASAMNSRIDCQIAGKSSGQSDTICSLYEGDLDWAFDLFIPATPGHVLHMRAAKGESTLTQVSNGEEELQSAHLVHIGDYGDWAYFSRMDRQRVLIRRSRIVEFSRSAGAYVGQSEVGGEPVSVSERMVELIGALIERLENNPLPTLPSPPLPADDGRLRDVVARLEGVERDLDAIEARTTDRDAKLDDLADSYTQLVVATFKETAQQRLEDALAARLIAIDAKLLSIRTALEELERRPAPDSAQTPEPTEVEQPKQSEGPTVDDVKFDLLIAKVAEIAALIESAGDSGGGPRSGGDAPSWLRILGPEAFRAYPRGALEALGLRENADGIHQCLTRREPVGEIRFEHGAARTDSAALDEPFDGLVKALSDVPSGKAIVFLMGAASTSGPEAYNRRLSERRAEWVHERLAERLSERKEAIARHVFLPFARGEVVGGTEDAFGRHVSIVVCDG